MPPSRLFGGEAIPGPHLDGCTHMPSCFPHIHASCCSDTVPDSCQACPSCHRPVDVGRVGGRCRRQPPGLLHRLVQPADSYAACLLCLHQRCSLRHTLNWPDERICPAWHPAGVWAPDGRGIAAHGFTGALHIWRRAGMDASWVPQHALGGHWGPGGRRGLRWIRLLKCSCKTSKADSLGVSFTLRRNKRRPFSQSSHLSPHLIALSCCLCACRSGGRLLGCRRRLPADRQHRPDGTHHHTPAWRALVRDRAAPGAHVWQAPLV